MQFQYTARSTDGRTVIGSLEAVDETAALRLLSEKFELVTQIQAAERAGRGRRLFGQRFGSEDLLAFTEQLSQMLESGIALTSALEILLQDTGNSPRNAVLADILSSLNSGLPLSDALEHHPRVFSPLYTSLVRAGESSGKLPLMLARVATYLERSEAMRRQLKAALIYPSIVLGFAFLVVTLVLVFGVPRMSQMYASLGAQLPWVTRVFVDICAFLARFWYVWVVGLAALLYGITLYLRSASGMRTVQALSTGLFWNLMRNVAMARFCRTLSTLYASGVPLGDGLEMVARGLGVPRLEKQVLEVREGVMNGEALALALRRRPDFPALLVGMVSAGQESGSLDRMLDRLAEIYESKVDAGLRAAVAALEPLVIILVGLMVGGTLVVLGLPFLNLGSLF